MIRTSLAIALFVVDVALAWPLVQEVNAADRCLESGGSFDYRTGQCDFKVTHPSTGMWQRHGLSLFAALAFGLGGCLLLFRGKKSP